MIYIYIYMILYMSFALLSVVSCCWAWAWAGSVWVWVGGSAIRDPGWGSISQSIHEIKSNPVSIQGWPHLFSIWTGATGTRQCCWQCGGEDRCWTSCGWGGEEGGRSTTKRALAVAVIAAAWGSVEAQKELQGKEQGQEAQKWRQREGQEQEQRKERKKDQDSRWRISQVSGRRHPDQEQEKENSTTVPKLEPDVQQAAAADERLSGFFGYEVKFSLIALQKIGVDNIFNNI